MNSASISHIAFNPLHTPNAQPARIMLLQRESVSLHIRAGQEMVRVVSGCAWISHEGKDIVLKSGEQELLPRGRFETLISSLSQKPLVLELHPAPATATA